MPDSPPPLPEFLTTRELADLLRIKERKVYDLAASGKVPCSKAMGKLLFPRDAINAWLAQGGLNVAARPRTTPSTLFLGSHDPLLEWALRESQCGIATYFDGSSDGLERFTAGDGIATGLHLQGDNAHDWNIGPVRNHCSKLPVALVEWARRRRGLIVHPSESNSITSMADLRGKRIVPRQSEAGAQKLFLHLLAKADLSPTDLEFTSAARSEMDAAVTVLEGSAVAAFGLQAFAAQYKLTFIPILEERFDILYDRRAWFEPPLQTFFAFCRTDSFSKRASGLAGYDVSNAGQVHFNGP